MIRKRVDKEADKLPNVLDEKRQASRRLVARVLRAQQLQEAVVHAAVQQLTGQGALQT